MGAALRRIDVVVEPLRDRLGVVRGISKRDRHLRHVLEAPAVGDRLVLVSLQVHGLVRDGQGRKMSKSLGNIIDPLDMIEKYGADATRLSLVIGAAPGTDPENCSAGRCLPLHRADFR